MKTVSTNIVILSGRLTADATTNDKKSFARFSIAHNMGTSKDGQKRVVFANFKMFNNHNGKTVEIPFSLLKKGTPVEVHAYFSPFQTEKTSGFEFIVKNVNLAAPVKDNQPETAPDEPITTTDDEFENAGNEEFPANE